jgi:hypothetical protein
MGDATETIKQIEVARIAQDYERDREVATKISKLTSLVDDSVGGEICTLHNAVLANQGLRSSINSAYERYFNAVNDKRAATVRSVVSAYEITVNLIKVSTHVHTLLKYQQPIIDRALEIGELTIPQATVFADITTEIAYPSILDTYLDNIGFAVLTHMVPTETPYEYTAGDVYQHYARSYADDLISSYTATKSSITVPDALLANTTYTSTDLVDTIFKQYRDITYEFEDQQWSTATSALSLYHSGSYEELSLDLKETGP